MFFLIEFQLPSSQRFRVIKRSVIRVITCENSAYKWRGVVGRASKKCGKNTGKKWASVSQNKRHGIMDVSLEAIMVPLYVLINKHDCLETFILNLQRETL